MTERKSSTDKFTEQTDIRFKHSIYRDGAVQPTASFSDIEYVVAKNNGEVVLQKTLDEGVTALDSENFEIHIDDADLVRGDYIHQITPTDLIGDVLEPSFQRKLKVTRKY